jgi:hypothetical protein
LTNRYEPAFGRLPIVQATPIAVHGWRVSTLRGNDTADARPTDCRATSHLHLLLRGEAA